MKMATYLGILALIGGIHRTPMGIPPSYSQFLLDAILFGSTATSMAELSIRYRMCFPLLVVLFDALEGLSFALSSSRRGAGCHVGARRWCRLVGGLLTGRGEVVCERCIGEEGRMYWIRREKNWWWECLPLSIVEVVGMLSLNKEKC